MSGLEFACRSIEAETWRGELIIAYRDCALRWSSFLSSRYPGEDFDPLVMSGLYMAAATYDPGRTKFLNWLKIKIRSAVSQALRRRHRRARGHLTPGRLPKSLIRRCSPSIILVRLDPDIVDSRFFYRENPE